MNAYLDKLDAESANRPSVEDTFVQFKANQKADTLVPLNTLEHDLSVWQTNHPDFAAAVRNGLDTLKSTTIISRSFRDAEHNSEVDHLIRKVLRGLKLSSSGHEIIGFKYSMGSWQQRHISVTVQLKKAHQPQQQTTTICSLSDDQVRQCVQETLHTHLITVALNEIDVEWQDENVHFCRQVPGESNQPVLNDAVPRLHKFIEGPIGPSISNLIWKQALAHFVYPQNKLRWCGGVWEPDNSEDHKKWVTQYYHTNCMVPYIHVYMKRNMEDELYGEYHGKRIYADDLLQMDQVVIQSCQGIYPTAQFIPFPFHHYLPCKKPNQIQRIYEAIEDPDKRIQIIPNQTTYRMLFNEYASKNRQLYPQEKLRGSFIIYTDRFDRVVTDIPDKRTLCLPDLYDLQQERELVIYRNITEYYCQYSKPMKIARQDRQLHPLNSYVMPVVANIFHYTMTYHQTWRAHVTMSPGYVFTLQMDNPLLMDRYFRIAFATVDEKSFDIEFNTWHDFLNVDNEDVNCENQHIIIKRWKKVHRLADPLGERYYWIFEKVNSFIVCLLQELQEKYTASILI